MPKFLKKNCGIIFVSDSKVFVWWIGLPEWKNNNDQTYSCPRDWHLAASWEPIEGPPGKPRAFTALL